MRAVANGIFAGLSAVLLSGCSWLGAGLGYDNSSYYGNQTRSAQHNSKYGIGAYETGQYGSGAYGNQSGAYAGQQAQYTTGGYGSHVGSAQTAGYIKAAPTVKRPTLRGSFGLEFDHSLAGTLYDTANGTGASAYNRAAFAEAFQSGVIIDGDLVTTTYTSTPERILAPEI
ncbi:MAG: hypothetical protein JKX72_05060, partial [Robiginitomaculum sp.]|nr:hypothetical protein [Robiginitomaculum sp.]